MDTKKIGAFLKQCRKEKNLTQDLQSSIVYVYLEWELQKHR